jgi:hypothetical protein
MRGMTSYAKRRRETLGLESRPAVDPEISAKRRAAAYKSHVTRGLTPPEALPALVRQAERQADAAAVAQRREAGMVQNLLADQSDSGGARGRQVAHCAAPGVMARLIEIADGLHGAGVREQIAAGRLVLEVAGAMEADAGGRENAPLSQETVSALRRVMASGEERLVLLEEVIREREAATIEGEAARWVKPFPLPSPVVSG